MFPEQNPERDLEKYHDSPLSEKSDHQLAAEGESGEVGIDPEKEKGVPPSIYDEPELQTPLASPKVSSDATDFSSPPDRDKSLNEKSLASADFEDTGATPPQYVSENSDIRQDGSPLGEVPDVEAPSPNEIQPQRPRKQGWRRPRQNVWKMGHVCLAFLNFGLNDASYGVCPFSCSFIIEKYQSRPVCHMKHELPLK